MTTLALALILSAAFFHATWNWLAKRAGGGATFVWLFAALSVLIYGPLAAAILIWQRPPITPLTFVFLAGSTCFHLAYYIVLQRGYRQGDLSLVYPLARGTGPMLSTVAAIVFLGERPTPLALFGALLVIVSIFALTGGTKILQDRSTQVQWALRYGLLTGTIIAGYTLWDKYAVSTVLIPPLLLDWGTSVGRTIVLAPHALRNWDEVRHEWQTNRREAIGVAVLSPLSYILVLTALQFTPVSYVAPTREISILIGTLIGARVLAEGDARRRLAAASIMVLGVVALALG